MVIIISITWPSSLTLSPPSNGEGTPRAATRLRPLASLSGGHHSPLSYERDLLRSTGLFTIGCWSRSRSLSSLRLCAHRSFCLPCSSQPAGQIDQSLNLWYGSHP